MEKIEIPTKVNKLIKAYQELVIKGKKVRCPYFRNVKRVRAELRSLVGKGTPEEIVEEVLIYAKLRGVNLDNMTEQEIREFMQTQGIGIDCSGYVSHLYDAWLKTAGKGSIQSHFKFQYFSLFSRFRIWLRPIENMSANQLTGSDNTTKVQLKDAQVGDMIRLKGLEQGHHVALVIGTALENGILKSITYTHSTERYGDQNGVAIAEIKIKNQDGELKDQEWLEKDTDGTCWTLKQLEKDYEDNGLRRPNWSKDLTNLKAEN